MDRLNSVADLTRFRLALQRRCDPYMTEIAVCSDTGCQAWGAEEVASRLEAELSGEGTNRKVRVKRVGCMGLCERGPLVAIRPHGIFYQRVSTEDVPEVVSETIGKYKHPRKTSVRGPGERKKIRVPSLKSRFLHSRNDSFYLSTDSLTLVPSKKPSFTAAIPGWKKFCRVLGTGTRG